MSPRDAQCRICIISSSLESARTLINRIQGITETVSLVQDETSIIPWTISNKYYTADVHFSVSELTSSGSPDISIAGAPAVILVWTYGKPYRQHVLQVAKLVQDHEPEVVLAVRLADASSPIDSVEQAAEEDDSEVDEFLSSHGFEFINAARESGALADQEDVYSDGIPGLPRVLDALSTIMWSSMEAHNSGARHRHSNAERVLDWAQADMIGRSDTLEDLASNTSTLEPTELRMKREMDELARWLEEDIDSADAHQDPWKTATSSGTAAISASPTDIDAPVSTMSGNHPCAMQFGFEDDFTVFISAPADEQDVSSPTEQLSDTNPNPDHVLFDEPLASGNTEQGDTHSLAPASQTYHSLGSVSDVAESRENDSDDDFPTQEEIQNTADLIFSHTSSAPDIDGFSFDTLPAASGLDIPRNVDEPESEEVSDSYEMAHFDLSRVLGVLEGMKSDISSIESESERRKAAARVALGLVYGLESRGEE